uniref:Uncharacterized protein n=1 Tax=Timema tahoe TaxID=61484 RepID=A0A7R9ITZ0_9NEOP|nr:unnamed protein product [Timema tahoe]
MSFLLPSFGTSKTQSNLQEVDELHEEWVSKHSIDNHLLPPHPTIPHIMKHHSLHAQFLLGLQLCALQEPEDILCLFEMIQSTCVPTLSLYVCALSQTKLTEQPPLKALKRREERP